MYTYKNTLYIYMYICIYIYMYIHLYIFIYIINSLDVITIKYII